MVKKGNNVDSSLKPDANVSSGLAIHPDYLEDLPNLFATEKRNLSLCVIPYIHHSQRPCPKDGTGFQVSPVYPSCHMNFFPTEQL